MVIENPELLNVMTNSQYMPTRAVLKEENELIRLLEQPKLDYNAISKSILNGAKVRFSFCEFDNGELTEELKEEIANIPITERITYKEMKDYIRQVIVQPDGEIISVYINNAKISNGGAENGS